MEKERFGEDAEYQPLIDSLRAFCKTMEKSSAKLDALLTNPQFEALLNSGTTLGSVRDQLISLILFLKWKHLAQKAGAASIDMLLMSIDQYSGNLPRGSIESAVWLFGAVCGFDRLAKEIYSRRPSEFPFMHASGFDAAVGFSTSFGLNMAIIS